MISYHNGDLLKSGCDIICHQVNIQGIMGGGIARKIAKIHPLCEMEYSDICKENYPDDLYGRVHFYKYGDHKRIANCFSQDENFCTNYEWLKECVTTVKEYAKDFNCKTVGIPFKYGAGIANGDWNIIEKIWCDTFEQEEIELQIWKLD